MSHLPKFLRRLSSRGKLKAAKEQRRSTSPAEIEDVPALPAPARSKSTGTGSEVHKDVVSSPVSGPIGDGGNGNQTETARNDVVKTLDAVPIVKVETADAEEPAARQVSAEDAAAINDGPKLGYRDLKLDTIEDKIVGTIATATVNTTTALMIVAPIKELLITTGAVDALEAQVHLLAEGIPVLMNALDKVANLHPFIGVAVMVFKTVWALEMNRRANDKQIIALYAEMKDMMSVLTQLQDMHDIDKPAPDGTTIKGRMQRICENVAADIKACSNACDTYSKKKLLVKVLSSPLWTGKLTGFVATFTKRRGEFEFALAIHSAVGIDTANRTLMDVEKTTREMNERMAVMVKAFERLMSPEQQRMQEAVNDNGGIAKAEASDAILKSLLDLQPESGHSGSKKANKYSVGDLREEMKTDFETVLKANMELFDRKIELQQRQIVEEIQSAMDRGNDRIIAAVTSGAHERIADPDVYEIWKDMSWKGSVKARYFVFALRDYFVEKKISHDKDKENTEPFTDEWALEYLEVQYLQPIMEAFDDDASGFITVNEVNRFTKARPIDWSLLKWLAYWAIGANMSMVAHRDRITEIFNEMFALLPVVMEENRVYVSHYLTNVWENMTTFCSALEDWGSDEKLNSKFQKYLNNEKKKLKKNLEGFKYDIDEMNTLILITGKGRPEKHFFPLLRLVLEQHLKILRVARTNILHKDELYDSSDTVMWIFDALYDRYTDLEIVFNHRAADSKKFFERFAYGIYKYQNQPKLKWASKLIKADYETDAVWTAEAFEESEEESDDETEGGDDDMHTLNILSPIGDTASLNTPVEAAKSKPQDADSESIADTGDDKTSLKTPVEVKKVGSETVSASTHANGVGHETDVPPLPVPEVTIEVTPADIVAKIEPERPAVDKLNIPSGETKEQEKPTTPVAQKDPTSVLVHGVGGQLYDPTSAYETVSSAVVIPDDVDERLRPILGEWTGLVYNTSDDENIGRAMFTRTFVPRIAGPDDEEPEGALLFGSTGKTFDDVAYTIKGRCTPREGRNIAVYFSMTHAERFVPIHWWGEYDPTKNSLVGTFGPSEDETVPRTGSFLYSKAPGYILTARPGPGCFKRNRAKALWRFACDATLLDVRRRWFTWSGLKERRDSKATYVDLCVRYLRIYWGRLLEVDELKTFREARQKLRPEDVQLVSFQVRVRLGMNNPHSPRGCDACSQLIGPDRVVCLDCDSTADQFDTLDLCGHPLCMASTVTDREDIPPPHLPSHNMIKLRTLVLLRTFGNVFQLGKAAVDRGNAFFTSEVKEEKQKSDQAKAIVSRPTDSSLRCLKCGEVPEKPCWYCAECSESTFICMKCDKPGGFSSEHPPVHVEGTEDRKKIDPIGYKVEFSRDAHLAHHMLAFCNHSSDVAEVKPGSMEAKMAEMELQIRSLHGRMDTISSLEEKMARLEALLLKLTTQITVPNGTAHN